MRQISDQADHDQEQEKKIWVQLNGEMNSESSQHANRTRHKDTLEPTALSAGKMPQIV